MSQKDAIVMLTSSKRNVKGFLNANAHSNYLMTELVSGDRDNLF